MFDFSVTHTLGTVQTVDTASVIVEVSNIEQLKRLQVNRLVALQSSRAGESLIGVVQKIARSLDPKVKTDNEMISADLALDQDASINLVRIALIGTLIGRVGDLRNVFRRTLETVPDM